MTNLKLVLATAALSLSCVAVADDMSREQYRLETNRIDRDYEQAMQRCAASSGNAKDVCEKQARGRQTVDHAALDAQRADTGRAHRRAAMARIEAEYDVAKERCDDAKGNEKDACLKRAHADYRNARTDLRRDMVTAGGPGVAAQ